MEVGVRAGSGNPASGGALEEPDLEEEGLVDLLDRLGFLRDLEGTARLQRHAEDARGTLDDGDEVVDVVVVEAGDEAEAVAQRTGDEASAGGGADQREAGQVEADRARRRTLADHDVELEVLH